MMQLIVLGIIPGTETQLTFTTILYLLLVLVSSTLIIGQIKSTATNGKQMTPTISQEPEINQLSLDKISRILASLHR